MTKSTPSDNCPKCGGELFQTDKNTFTGEVWREYTCRSCGHIVDVNEGSALWQVMHDAAEKAKQEKGGK
jgi:acetone carboxylase gamma subunit